MQEQRIENVIGEVLTGYARENALGLALFLRGNGLQFERGTGYWEDKFYFMVKHENEYVCYVLFNGGEDKSEPEGWTIWLDGGCLNGLEDYAPDEEMKEIAWAHVDICKNCGGCGNPGGTKRKIFGKDFDSICITPMRFENPDGKSVECVKRIIEISFQVINEA